MGNFYFRVVHGIFTDAVSIRCAIFEKRNFRSKRTTNPNPTGILRKGRKTNFRLLKQLLYEKSVLIFYVINQRYETSFFRKRVYTRRKWGNFLKRVIRDDY